FVAREQRVRGAAEDRSKLPAQIVGVLQAGIEPLPAGRRMDVSSIARQEHASYPKAIRQTCMHIVGRNPYHGAKPDVVSAGASPNHGGQPRGGDIDIALQGDDSLQLEKVGSAQWT